MNTLNVLTIMEEEIRFRENELQKLKQRKDPFLYNMAKYYLDDRKREYQFLKENTHEDY